MYVASIRAVWLDFEGIYNDYREVVAALLSTHFPCFGDYSPQKVVDFQWSRNPDLPWTMMSVSDDAADEQVGGGSMQVWRINHLIYRDEEEVVSELEKHRYGERRPGSGRNGGV